MSTNDESSQMKGKITEEDWGNERKVEKDIVVFNDVTPHARLHFAKNILIYLFILFIVIIAISIIFPTPIVEKIWSFTSVAINSIVAVLVGYYFTTKS